MLIKLPDGTFIEHQAVKAYSAGRISFLDGTVWDVGSQPETVEMLEWFFNKFIGHFDLKKAFSEKDKIAAVVETPMPSETLPGNLFNEIENEIAAKLRVALGREPKPEEIELVRAQLDAQFGTTVGAPAKPKVVSIDSRNKGN